MGKLSLYDLLTILLPGALLTLVIEIIANDLGFKIEDFELDQYFTLTIFLSSSIFIGLLINISTRGLLKLYKKIGLYTPVYKIYNKSETLIQIKPFIGDRISKLYKDSSEEQGVEYFWSEMYFELEATGKISNPKAFQSFYFFFRNFFTLGILLLLPLVFLIIDHWFLGKYLFFMAVNLLGIVLSVLVSSQSSIDG